MKKLRLLVLLAVGAMALPATPALALTYTVDTTSDAVLAACTGAAADCSLRGAIANANASGVADTITFDNAVFPDDGTPTVIATASALPFMTGAGDTISALSRGVLIDADNVEPNPAAFYCININAAGITVRNLHITDCFGALRLLEAGDDAVIANNVLFDNTVGIEIANADGAVVVGNKMGTDAAGAAIAPEGGNSFGLSIGNFSDNNTIGGDQPLERNIISGNGDGVQLNSLSTGNVVTGNFIGTDVTGTVDLGNTSQGLQLSGGASGYVIGGLGPGEGNLISGNTSDNILILSSAGNTILGNIIGPDINGSGAAMTNQNGINITSSSTGNVIGPRNVISDNDSQGVRITGAGTQGNVVKGNLIGTGLSGTGAVPNTDGVAIQSDASGNTIGGAGIGDGNVIAFNTSRGVVVNGSATDGNSIRGNSIHDHTPLPEIDQVNGGNNDLAAPSVLASDGATVSGTACPYCVVDVFTDSAGDPRHYEGSATATSGGAFSFTKPGGFTAPNAMATQTDLFGNTSEVSAFIAAADNDGDGVGDGIDPDDDNDGLNDGSDSCPLLAEDFDGFADADGCPDPDNDLDGVVDVSDSGKYCFDPAATLACHLAGPIDCRNVAEDIDAFKDTDGCPEPDNDNDGFPDATDACPGTTSIAGADGMLGSPQDVNHNGVQDGAEAALTTDDTPLALSFEDYDNVLDTDGCHDSPGGDFDGDGYTDDNEALFIGTNPGYPCGINGWPSNLNDAGFSGNRLDILDVTSFVAPVRHFEKSPGDPGFDARWDIKPGDGGLPPKYINILDVTTLVAGPTGNPPMLNGARAFGKDCPLPP